ncbi:MAG: heavy-metal-associated domain-containing protein [Vicinamibacteria bacterium]|nr:heavy-metal-associated domain-containing protein [Vicinamibacteria bacterium]
MKKFLLLAALAQLALSPGVRAEEARTTLSIQGMTCGGCVAAVKLQLGRTEGVKSYDVSLQRAEADVAYEAARTEPARIAESVSRTGFKATVKPAAKPKATRQP